jgi:hypothetical protein
VTFRRNVGSDDLAEGGLTGFIRSLLAGIPWSEHAEGEEELHLEPPSGGIFRLHNANGRTRVCGEDRSDIEVRVAKTARAESAEAAEWLLEQIWVASAENEGALDASIADVEGNIAVVTSNAKVCCSRTCGKLVARSSNGKIEIDEHRGSVDASTSNGLIRASLEEVGKQGVQLATSNGRIVLELPEEVDADVDIRVDNGVIRNDRSLRRATRETNGRLSGRLGSGGALIKLRTSNGSIALR